jgi:hypothetical protein
VTKLENYEEIISLLQARIYQAYPEKASPARACAEFVAIDFVVEDSIQRCSITCLKNSNFNTIA